MTTVASEILADIRGKFISGMRGLTRTRENRVVFKCLPSYCSNDLVEGSWWFVWGSLLSSVVACVPLADVTLHFFYAPKDTELEAFGESSTWVLVIIMGLLFTLGAFAFVRAFEEPVKEPLLGWTKSKHVNNDELLGAWLTFLGCVPGIFYCIVYLYHDPRNNLYWAAFIVSLLFSIGALLFVIACYETDEFHTRKAYTKMFVKSLIGDRPSLLKHVSNDFLAVCWVMFLVSLIGTIAALIYVAGLSQNQRQDFVYATSFIDGLIFTIGSAYFVAGSYHLNDMWGEGKPQDVAKDADESYVDTTNTANVVLNPAHSMVIP